MKRVQRCRCGWGCSGRSRSGATVMRSWRGSPGSSRCSGCSRAGRTESSRAASSSTRCGGTSRPPASRAASTPMWPGCAAFSSRTGRAATRTGHGVPPAEVLVSSGGGYLLRLGPGGLDAGQFEECLARARGLRASGDPHGAARVVDEALGLWRGQPFAGVPGPFAEAERLRLTELRTTAAEERADLLLAPGPARGGGARADRACRRAPAARAGARAADDRPVPVRQAGRGAARLPRRAGAARRGPRHRPWHRADQDPPAACWRWTRRSTCPFSAAPPGLGRCRRSRPGRRRRLPRRLRPSPAPWLRGRRSPVTPAEPAPCPAQLPSEPAGFVGRTAELDWLHGLLPGAFTGPGQGAAGFLGRADHRDRGRRQVDAGDPVRPAGVPALPRRPAVREPARVRPGQRADAAGHGAAVVLRRAGVPAVNVPACPGGAERAAAHAA